MEQVNNDMFEFIKAYIIAETSNNNAYIDYELIVRSTTYAYNEAKNAVRKTRK